MKETPLFFFPWNHNPDKQIPSSKLPKKRKQTKPIKINQPKVQKETEIENTSKKKREKQKKKSWQQDIQNIG